MNSTMVGCKNVWAPSYLSLLTAIIGSVFCIVITFGNLMIVIAVVKDPLKKLRSPFNYFVVNLAVADLIVGIVSMPIGIYNHTLEYLKTKPDVLKRVFTVTLFISLTASLLCLIILSVDRYIAITFPIKYRSNLTWRKCWIGSFIIWILSLSLPLVYLKVGYINYLMIYINTAVVIATITLVMTYIRIYKFLRGQIERMKEISRTTSNETKMLESKRTLQQKKVTRVFLWILVLFLACYIPATIIVYILQFCTICNCESIHVMRDTTFYLLTVNSCMNPFVYALKNKHYRHALTQLWKNSRDSMSSLTRLLSLRGNDADKD